jgi:hypothetical protein
MKRDPRRSEFPPILPMQAWNKPLQAYLEVTHTELYRMGLLTVWYRHNPHVDEYDLSISHPKRYPTWDEIAHLRYKMLPQDRAYAMLLPNPKDYVAIAKNMFHLVEVYANNDEDSKNHTFIMIARGELDPNSNLFKKLEETWLPEDVEKMREFLEREN